MKTSVLRSDFLRIRERLKEEAKRADEDGAYARAMLSIMPGFIDYLHNERHAKVPRVHSLDAMSNIIAELILKTVETHVQIVDKHRALDLLLSHAAQTVRPKLERSDNGIFLPPGESG